MNALLRLHVIMIGIVCTAGPVVTGDNDKNMVEGDKLEFKCVVTGYPTPEVKWYKNTVPMNDTDSKRIHFEEHEGVEHAKLTIFDLTYDDAAVYKCEATNDFEPKTASFEMELRVKGMCFTTSTGWCLKAIN